jgi:hypothetical protein
MFQLPSSSHPFDDRADTGAKVLAQQCPVCKQQRAPLQVHVLEEREDARIVHADCEACGSHMLAIISSARSGSSVGFLTDLTLPDVERFATAKPLSADDVIAMSKSLANV